METTSSKKRYTLTELLSGQDILEVGRTRDILLRYGIRLLHRQGVDGTSIGKLLSATGKSKSQFYLHFRDKDDFICQILELQMSTMLHFMKKKPLSKLEQFKDWFSPYLELARLPGHLGCPVGPLAAELSPSNESVRLVAREQFERWSQVVENSLLELSEGESFRSEFQAAPIATRLCVSIQGAFLMGRVYQDDRFMLEVREQYLELLKSWAS